VAREDLSLTATPCRFAHARGSSAPPLRTSIVAPALHRPRAGDRAMTHTCHCCGNTYDKAFEVTMNGASYTFDCFECAIHTLAPTCGACGLKIVGHGIEADGVTYCCASCARREGVHGARDRVGA
jgi:hypothetical protein